MGAGHPHPEWGNATAKATIAPYLPTQQLDNTTLRLICRRARLNERPALRTLINSITTISQSQPPDIVTWLGAFMSTERFNFDTRYDISRPAYITCRFRFLPANITGVFSSFWIYAAGEESHPAGDGKSEVEIDIFESNDLVPGFWKTNFHHQRDGGIKFDLTHNNAWIDGNWHTVGFLWEQNRMQVYRDGVLDGEVTGPNVSFFSVPMRLMITHTCDPHWIVINPAALSVPAGVEQVYFDLDRIEVWTTGPPPNIPPLPGLLSTGNVAEDIYDDLIVQYCAQYGHPNPRIVKCQVKWESDQVFDIYCTSADTPCGIFPGWTSAESRSFGLLQVTPACGESGDGAMLLANGHPNMTTSVASTLWGGSVYNPSLNLKIGIEAIAGGYDHFKALFPACSDDNLVLMAAAGYVGNWSGVTSCGVWNEQGQLDYVQNVIRIYEEWWGDF
jgi:glycosyl hydrolase family 16